MKVKIINKSSNPLPHYATEGSAGMDLRANIDSPITLKFLEQKIIPTGLFVEIPKGGEGQIRPRSGLAYKKGIIVINAPGTIDSDYRGELGVILINLSLEDVIIEPAERIAQIVFKTYERVELEEVEVLNESDRGSGGFGSTGNR